MDELATVLEGVEAGVAVTLELVRGVEEVVVSVDLGGDGGSEPAKGTLRRRKPAGRAGTWAGHNGTWHCECPSAHRAATQGRDGRPMVKLTCLVRRKAGMSPAEFHAYWRENHGPLVTSTESGSHVVRYVQHHRSLEDYGSDDDGGFDGVTEQWFESMDEYRRARRRPRLPRRSGPTSRSFLDVDRLFFVLTEEPVVIVDGEVPGP